MTTYTAHLYETGPAGHLYVIQPTDSDVSELDRTLLDLHGATCDAGQHATCRQFNNTCGRSTCRRPELVADLLTILQRATTDTGFDTSFFRPPKGYIRPTRALERGPLRVYGLRYDETLFVAGPASLKLVRQIKDDPAVAQAYYLVERFRVELDRRLRAVPGHVLDLDGHPVPPRDEHGRCYLPDSLLHSIR